MNLINLIQAAKTARDNCVTDPTGWRKEYLPEVNIVSAPDLVTGEVETVAENMYSRDSDFILAAVKLALAIVDTSDSTAPETFRKYKLPSDAWGWVRPGEASLYHSDTNETINWGRIANDSDLKFSQQNLLLNIEIPEDKDLFVQDFMNIWNGKPGYWFSDIYEWDMNPMTFILTMAAICGQIEEGWVHVY